MNDWLIQQGNRESTDGPDSRFADRLTGDHHICLGRFEEGRANCCGPGYALKSMNWKRGSRIPAVASARLNRKAQSFPAGPWTGKNITGTRSENWKRRKSACQKILNGWPERFLRIAGEKLSDLNTKQLDTLLKPLNEKLTEFRNTVENAHKQETAQHEVMKEKIGDLEKLNERLHDDATNLSRALTTNVKAQGSWG